MVNTNVTKYWGVECDAICERIKPEVQKGRCVAKCRSCEVTDWIIQSLSGQVEYLKWYHEIQNNLMIKCPQRLYD